MKHFKHSALVLVCSFILFTGCKKEIETDSKFTTGKLQNENSLKQSPQLSAATREKLNKLRASLPAGLKERVQQNSNLLLKTHPQYRDMVRRALRVIEPTPCDGNTIINQWLNQELADWNDETFFYASITGMTIFPTYDALFFENSSANQYFGVNGEYTQRIKKTFKDLQRFWNIPSDDIVLVAMHGSMLLNREKLIRIDKIIYGDNQEVAEYWADLILSLLDEVPQYRNGNHPIFTFNAYAQPAFNFPPYGFIPDKIVMGDGIMEAYTGIGYGDVAPQAILAHEFGHQIQFQLNLFEDEWSPEATRRTELMADAYAAYYLSHARGASMQWKRVQQFLQVFFNIGDCGFSDPNHHGTPTQRMAAAEWAYNLANSAQKQGHILTSEEFARLFDAQLPELIKL